jgi:hypothetical protein
VLITQISLVISGIAQQMYSQIYLELILGSEECLLFKFHGENAGREDRC